jgi:predicted methyltransferase
MNTLKLFTLAGLTTVAAAYDEQALVDKINNTPQVLWKAEVNGLDHGSFKKLLGVHQGKSYDAVQKLPRHVSKIRDEDIPDSFDSETNWPQCAKVIGRF